MSSWGRIGYAALCVIVPVAWGLLVVFVSNRIDKRLLARRSADKSTETAGTLPPLDYHI